MHEIERLLRDQDGVIARRQAMSAGVTRTDVARRLRRREWVTIHAGVYVGHTGEPTWQQRAWEAVLYSWPAGLSLDSALRAFEGPGHRDRDSAVIHVAVERHRHLVVPPGVRLHRVARLQNRVLWNLGPPRMRYDDAVLDLAAQAPSDVAAIARLADAVGARRTTAQRMLAALDERPRLARRAWLGSVLDDVADGACSVLEQGYLTRVERAHGLPRGERQHPAVTEGRSMFRDVVYAEQGLVVELDGRLAHDSAAARDRDLERDLDAAVTRVGTVRLGYGHIFDRGCSTAVKIGRILRARGWAGAVLLCPDCPPNATTRLIG